jgi:hypothetical protein
LATEVNIARLEEHIQTVFTGYVIWPWFLYGTVRHILLDMLKYLMCVPDGCFVH